MNTKLLNEKVILVVDDEAELRQCTLELFEMYAAKVIEAENITTAMDVLKNKKIDVVISDVKMPGGDGLILMERIDRELAYKPLLFLYTGFCDFSVGEVLKLGVLKIFDKPCDSMELVRGVIEEIQNRNNKDL